MRISFLLIVFNLLIFNNVYSKEEVVFNAASSFVVQNDSLKISYLNAKNYYDKKDYTTSLRLALSLLKENKNLISSELILTNQLIANIFFESKSSKNSVRYYRKTLEFFNKYEMESLDSNIKKQNFDINLIKAETYLGLGSSYYRLNAATDLKIYKDSSFYYYNQVEKLIYNDSSILQIKSRAYTNLSAMYMNDSVYGKAKDFALRSIDIHKKLNNKVNLAAALGNLSSIYLSENNFSEAKKNYIEALDLIRNIKTSKALEVRESLYYNLAYNLYKLKDYKAYNYQELSYIIKDSLRDKEFRKMIAEINAANNFDLGKELGVKEEENRRLKDQRVFFVIGIISFIIILSLLFWINFYKLKQKNLRLELSQSQLIQNHYIDKIKSESQARILNATIDGKETERKQIAETLHDSVSALLSSANLHLQATRSHFNGKTPIEIEKTQKIIAEASQTIRDLSHTLVSSVLLKFGIEYALKDMADKYSNSKIKIDTNIGDIRRYHQNFEIKVYNIIQEFVNNILKHSKAENAMIEMNEIDGKLSFKIVDDGIGFDKTLINNKDGLGLNQIEARIKMMDGYFFVNSNKGNGTIISVVLPILEKEKFILS